VPRLFDHAYAYFFQLPDGRIFFAIPYERDFTLIGTTDADHTGPLDDVRASEAEIVYLCEGVNRYFARQVRPGDVVWSYAGVRPLIDASAPGADADLDPAGLPPLAIVVDDLRVAAAPLGRMQLRTRPTAEGLQVESLQLRSKGQVIDVDGAWTGRGAQARTRMQVAVQSEDFGALLAGLGMAGRIDGGAGTARFEGAWPGSPAGFTLGALEGSLALAVKDGRLVEVDPGAGRVLGLLSVAELPRRLMLDFRDLFSRGFVFNRVGGTVRFDDGLAHGENLVIDGAAAEIHIRGSADMRAQTYDQVIEVFPRTGGLLTAVGAITAGPVGAAVGAVANAVFEKPLGRMGARTYHVTGPWKDPKVVVEGRELPATPAAAPDPAAESSTQRDPAPRP
jgi:uncharacterized protein YhdP